MRILQQLRVIVLSAIFNIFALDLILGQLMTGYEYSTETAEQYKELNRQDMEQLRQASETDHEHHVTYHEKYNENFHDIMERQQESTENTSEKFENDHEKYYSDSLGNRRRRVPEKGDIYLGIKWYKNGVACLA